MGGLLVAAAALTLLACGDKSQSVSGVTAQSAQVQSTPAGPAKRDFKVALVMKTLTNPFFVEMEKGARRAEKEGGVTLLVKTATQETSIEQQIQIIEEMVQAKVDAIVIAPGDSQRVVPALKKAQDAGIKVVNIDNRLDADAMKKSGMSEVPFISVDNEAAAYQSARFIAEQATKPTSAAILEGIRTADNAQKRRAGAERAFKENAKIKLVAQETANWKIDEAYEVSKSIFKAHPDIRLVFCANDMMAIGVMKFIQESGRKDVLLAGFDALNEAKAAVKDGKMQVTVDQQAAEQGYQGVQAALKALRGEAVPTEIKVDARLITKDSAD
ncbi:substrate-binding domain-containing protein [Niveibacterium umoris]|nr:substrate-binding domain-containing protein [Niveibacterium umoris]